MSVGIMYDFVFNSSISELHLPCHIRKSTPSGQTLENEPSQAFSLYICRIKSANFSTSCVFHGMA